MKQYRKHDQLRFGHLWNIEHAIQNSSNDHLFFQAGTLIYTLKPTYQQYQKHSWRLWCGDVRIWGGVRQSEQNSIGHITPSKQGITCKASSSMQLDFFSAAAQSLHDETCTWQTLQSCDWSQSKISAPGWGNWNVETRTRDCCFGVSHLMWQVYKGHKSQR